MRTIERTNQFKRDYKREAKGRHSATLDSDLKSVFIALASDQPLEPRYRDHALTGDWKDHRGACSENWGQSNLIRDSLESNRRGC